MLIAVGGLMASLVLPGQAVPTIVVTAATSAFVAVRRRLKKRRLATVSTSPSLKLSPTDPVTLEWAGVTCTLSKKATPRKLLDNVSGVAKPGRILAIMGPSGSGKTTLLNSLAGRVPASPNIELYGSISVNGIKSTTLSDFPVAYVTQEDLFFSQLTVQETLEVAASLRLSASKEERLAVVDNVLRTLGLVSVAETRVGDAKDRGISGGEKKRLSLACELISTPKLILCDEPTTGLDTFQAEKVMTVLQNLAKAGHTVVCSIHQPSGTIFEMCDDLILLASGQSVYFGPTSDAPDFFQSAGFPIPNHVNPAERYLELVSVDYSTDAAVSESRARIDRIVKEFDTWRSDRNSSSANESLTSKKSENKSTETAVVKTPSRRPNVVSQIRILFLRAWRQIIRDKKTNVSRLMSSLFSALLFGSIYWRLGLTQRTIQDRMGLLQVCTINSAMTAMIKTLNVFPREGVLVNRERVRGSYSVLEYFSSKLIAEMPVSSFFPLLFSSILYPMVRLSGGAKRVAKFLGIITLESFTAASYGLAVGAIIPSTEAALAAGPASFVLQIVFGGLYITDKSVPRWASWVPKISLIKHAYEALCVNEFRGLKFETQRPWDVKEGQQVLQRMSWGESTVAKACRSQARVLAFNYLLTYAMLTLRKPSFTQMKPVTTKENGESAKQATGESIHDALPNGSSDVPEDQKVAQTA